MDKYCKGCNAHWKHGKPGTKYTDWCTKYTNVASKIIGHCKLKGGKQDA